MLLLTAPFAAAARTITLTTCEWEPYAGENLPNYGFTSEIMIAAFERAGYEPELVILPWNRALATVRVGDMDAVYNAYYSEEREQEYAFTDPYVESPVMLCALRDFELDGYESLEDLRPYSIGVVRGYASGPEFDGADYLKKDEAPTDLSNLQKLLGKRVDLIVIDRFVATQYLKNSPVIQAGLSEVKFLEPPLQMLPVHLMFSRAVPGFEKVVQDFNTALQEIKADGTYEAILKKYGFGAVE